MATVIGAIGRNARIARSTTGVSIELSHDAIDLAQEVFAAAWIAAGQGAAAWTIFLPDKRCVRVEGGAIDAAAAAAKEQLTAAGVRVDED